MTKKDLLYQHACGSWWKRESFFFSFYQVVQENKSLEMATPGPNSLTDMFCLAQAAFLAKSEPTSKTWEIS